jgi:Peptidase family M23
LAVTIESHRFYATLARLHTEKAHSVNLGRSGFGMRTRAITSRTLLQSTANPLLNSSAHMLIQRIAPFIAPLSRAGIANQSCASRRYSFGNTEAPMPSGQSATSATHVGAVVEVDRHRTPARASGTACAVCVTAVNSRHLTRWGMISVATIMASVAPTGWAAAQVSNPSHDTRDPLTALRLQWPVLGPLNSGFGTRRSSGESGDVHAGVDIGARAGTPVQAPASAIVAFAGWQNGYGWVLILEHGPGIQSLYGHLSKFLVKRGQRVEQGATIGLTGNSGHSSGPHLHYEVRVNERPVNPRGPGSTVVVTGCGRRGGCDGFGYSCAGASCDVTRLRNSAAIRGFSPSGSEWAPRTMRPEPERDHLMLAGPHTTADLPSQRPLASILVLR